MWLVDYVHEHSFLLIEFVLQILYLLSRACKHTLLCLWRRPYYYFTSAHQLSQAHDLYDRPRSWGWWNLITLCEPAAFKKQHGHRSTVLLGDFIAIKNRWLFLCRVVAAMVQGQILWWWKRRRRPPCCSPHHVPLYEAKCISAHLLEVCHVF